MGDQDDDQKDEKDGEAGGPGLVVAMEALVLAGLVVRRRGKRHAW